MGQISEIYRQMSVVGEVVRRHQHPRNLRPVELLSGLVLLDNNARESALQA
jgi:hypothetical protein